MDLEKLSRTALEMRELSVAPYSKFRVGAAVLADSGRIYTGCNIETRSFSSTICAERVAIFKALSEGERDFRAMAVAGGYGEIPGDYCPPCGVCREVLSEFCGGDFKIVLVRSPEDFKIFTLEELFPMAFELK